MAVLIIIFGVLFALLIIWNAIAERQVRSVPEQTNSLFDTDEYHRLRSRPMAELSDSEFQKRADGLNLIEYDPERIREPVVADQIGHLTTYMGHLIDAYPNRSRHRFELSGDGPRKTPHLIEAISRTGSGKTCAARFSASLWPDRAGHEAATALVDNGDGTYTYTVIH